MIFGGATGKNLDILRKAMDVSVLRNNVIADNIANADTPNFKRTVVNFESQLKRALDSENSREFKPLLSDSRHIPFHRTLDYRNVKPRLVLDYLTTAKNNGNNVDIEESMMNALQNQLLYQTMAQVVSSQYSQINLVLR